MTFMIVFLQVQRFKILRGEGITVKGNIYRPSNQAWMLSYTSCQFMGFRLFQHVPLKVRVTGELSSPFCPDLPYCV